MLLIMPQLPHPQSNSVQSPEVAKLQTAANPTQSMLVVLLCCPAGRQGNKALRVALHTALEFQRQLQINRLQV
jgi:hypothetical protein